MIFLFFISIFAEELNPIKPLFVPLDEPVNSVVEVVVGEEVTIDMEETISGGYKWKLYDDSYSINNFVTYVSDYSVKKSETIPGAPSIHRFVFRGKQSGIATVLFILTRFGIVDADSTPVARAVRVVEKTIRAQPIAVPPHQPRVRVGAPARGTSAGAANANADAVADPVAYVDPMVGSGGLGHVWVGAVVPFGFAGAGPLEYWRGWQSCAGYHYSQNTIIGFAHTHLSGTGQQDLGDIVVMPYVAAAPLTTAGNENEPGSGYASRFTHENERCTPGFYRVLLDNGVLVELTASARVGCHTYTFPTNLQGKRAYVILDLTQGVRTPTTSTGLTQVDAQTWTGTRVTDGWSRNKHVYCAFRVQEHATYQVVEDSRLVLEFEGNPGTVHIKVGISATSERAALANLNAEVPAWDFAGVQAQAVALWNAELGKIAVTSTNETLLKAFYTGLYHAMIHPTLYSDVGQPDRYTVLSLWDTYRAAHPLYTWLVPSRVPDFVASMLDQYDRGDGLPVWPLFGWETGTMNGISSMQVIAEAVLKGVSGMDALADKAYTTLLAESNSDKRGLNYLRNLTYIPSEAMGDGLSYTMEFGVSFGSISLLAHARGDANNAAHYAKRARIYRQYWDAQTGFFRGRTRNGAFVEPFLGREQTQLPAYTEGNAYSYLYLAPQDATGLIEFFGGPDKFCADLDQFFVTPGIDIDPGYGYQKTGEWVLGNEHSNHIPYLYTYAGKQWKAADRIRSSVDDLFPPTVEDGYPGNEDAGQMGSWLVVSAIGFYPVFPANGDWVFGCPCLEEAVLSFETGKQMVVRAPAASSINRYIQSVTLNGRPYTRSYITQADLVAGGELVFEMGPQPNEQFGAAAADRPVADMAYLD